MILSTANGADKIDLTDYGDCMAASRGRKRHVQQELFRHGGKRRGAGRKPGGRRARECHAARPEFKASQPLHVVMRVVREVGSLRRRELYKALREATITAAMRERFRIVASRS